MMEEFYSSRKRSLFRYEPCLHNALNAQNSSAQRGTVHRAARKLDCYRDRSRTVNRHALVQRKHVALHL